MTCAVAVLEEYLYLGVATEDTVETTPPSVVPETVALWQHMHHVTSHAALTSSLKKRMIEFSSDERLRKRSKEFFKKTSNIMRTDVFCQFHIFSSIKL